MVRNIILGAALVFSVSAFVVVMYHNSEKTVYVDMGKIYGEFKLSKELNKELEEVVKTRERITDSLYRVLKTQSQEFMQKEKKTETEMRLLAKMEEEYLYKQKQFEEENRNASIACNEKIWNQINQYVMDYGKEKGYRFILGANGQGNIMYGDKEIDLTKELTNYINETYDGKIQ
jgi:outer membrane protein